MQGYVSTKHEGDKVIVFDRAGVVFVFNFNSSTSFTDYRIGVPAAGKYRIVLDSDDKEFGGHGRLDHNTDHLSFPEHFGGRPHSLMVCAVSLIMGQISVLKTFSLHFRSMPLVVPLLSWSKWTSCG